MWGLLPLLNSSWLKFMNLEYPTKSSIAIQHFGVFHQKWDQIGRTFVPRPWPLLLAPWPWHVFGRHKDGDGQHRRCCCRVPWLWWWAWHEMAEDEGHEIHGVSYGSFLFLCVFDHSLFETRTDKTLLNWWRCFDDEVFHRHTPLKDLQIDLI